jgi:predicted acetyltransferase
MRHRLTPELEQEGGHIGYHVVPSQRGKGHATRMLAQAVALLIAEGVRSVVITCAADNGASRRVIERNGGRLLEEMNGIARYSIAADDHAPRPGARSARKLQVSDT